PGNVESCVSRILRKAEPKEIRIRAHSREVPTHRRTHAPPLRIQRERSRIYRTPCQVVPRQFRGVEGVWRLQNTRVVIRVISRQVEPTRELGFCRHADSPRERAIRIKKESESTWGSAWNRQPATIA